MEEKSRHPDTDAAQSPCIRYEQSFRQAFDVLKPCLTLIVALLLAGCGQAPLHTESRASVGASSPDNARIYFLREANYVGVLVDFPFQIDDVGKFEIPHSSYFYVDVAPGDYLTRTSAPLIPGEFVIELKAERRAVYYLEVDYRQDSADAMLAGSMLGGSLVGWIVQASEAKRNGGVYMLTPLTAEQAKLMMQTLKFRQG